MTPTGFIALQVHSIGKDQTKVGLQVKWKNINIITKNLDKYKTPYTPVIPQVNFLDNTLTEREAAEGWKLLFDGKTSNGWMNAKTKTFPSNGWKIGNGTLTIDPADKKQGGGGDIVTLDKYKNFELIVDLCTQKELIAELNTSLILNPIMGHCRQLVANTRYSTTESILMQKQGSTGTEPLRASTTLSLPKTKEIMVPITGTGQKLL